MSRVVIKYNRIPETRREMRENATGFIRRLTFETKRYIVQSFTVSPSSPYEPPGVDTGALKNSISTRATSVLSGEVFTNVEYAVYLEFGTVRILPRPFMLPGLVWASTQVDRVAGEMRWASNLTARQDARRAKKGK